jgi:hypothetical protein
VFAHGFLVRGLVGFFSGLTGFVDVLVDGLAAGVGLGCGRAGGLIQPK